MNNFKKLSVLGVAVTLISMGIVTLFPGSFDVLGYERENLTLEVSGVNAIHPGFDRPPPYSNTYIGATSNDEIVLTAQYCNNDPEIAHGVEVRLFIPRDDYDATYKYFAYKVESASRPSGAIVHFYDDNDQVMNEVPSDGRGVNQDVAYVSWWFSGLETPTGECGDVSMTLKAAHGFVEGLDEEFQVTSFVTSDEVYPDWNPGNEITLRVITRPEFNQGDGEDNFYTGFNSNDFNNWRDPVDDITVAEELYHRIYVHNYPYETEARGIHVKIPIPSEALTSWILDAEISADNADSVNDTLTVNLASGEEASVMEFKDGTVVLYGTPQGPGGPSYENTPISTCDSTNNEAPCYTYSNRLLDILLPDQLGCEVYIMQLSFVTIFTQLPPEQTQDFEIVKRVLNQPDHYEEGDSVEYEVEITNTGELEIDQILFLDQYDDTLINFESMSGKLGDGGNEVDLTGEIEWGTSGDDREMRIDDLTTHLGDLPLGEKYVLSMHFTVREVPDVLSTCNLAIADDGLQQKQDQVCINLITQEEPPGQADFTIDKSVLTTNEFYRSGDTVRFQVEIQNTGDSVIDEMRFTDRWDNAILEFVDITGRLGVNGSNVNLRSVAEFRDTGSTSRELEIEDLTGSLGDLPVGQRYFIILEYTVRVVTSDMSTTNVAIAHDGERERQDQVSIPIRFIAPPPTDM